MDLLVSTEWLAAELGTDDLVVLDATSHPLDPARDAAAEFALAHVPGARHLDLATLSDPDDPVPGQAPSAGAFGERLAALGVREGARVVLYDDAPHRTAARAWWLFRLFGFERVALLDGGFATWRGEGRPIESGRVASPGEGGPAGARRPELVRDLSQMKAIVATGAAQIVDARSAARFSGAEPDPRRGVASGHLPGSRSLPYARLFEADGRWKRGQALAAEYRNAGIDLDAPIVTTCGSGVTAAILLFGLALLGRDASLYDGSWSEWGADAETAKEVGP